jgi:hypothetical protein
MEEILGMKNGERGQMTNDNVYVADVSYSRSFSNLANLVLGKSK